MAFQCGENVKANQATVTGIKSTPKSGFDSHVIFNKNFMEDVSIIEDAENNLELIMKDGRVYKNTLKD